MCMLMAHLGASQANQRDWEVCSSANGWTHDFTVPNAIRLLLGSDIQKVSSESLPPPSPWVSVCGRYLFHLCCCTLASFWFTDSTPLNHFVSHGKLSRYKDGQCRWCRGAFMLVAGEMLIFSFFSTELKSTISKRNHKHLRNVVMTWKGHHTVKKKVR